MELAHFAKQLTSVSEKYKRAIRMF